VFRITPIGGQSHRIQPELGDISVTLDVDVRRFIVFQAEEEEHVWADSQDDWHSVCSPALVFYRVGEVDFGERSFVI